MDTMKKHTTKDGIQVIKPAFHNVEYVFLFSLVMIEIMIPANDSSNPADII